jgi:hypothetical protein
LQYRNDFLLVASQPQGEVVFQTAPLDRFATTSAGESWAGAMVESLLADNTDLAAGQVPTNSTHHYLNDDGKNPSNSTHCFADRRPAPDIWQEIAVGQFLRGPASFSKLPSLTFHAP